jgi:transposase
MTDLRLAHERGLISHLPHYNTIFNVLGNDDLTPILISLLERSAIPLAPIEKVFAIDSTGLKTTRLVHGINKKTGEPTTDHDWTKIHVMIGTHTGIVTAIEIGDQNAYDGDFLPPLLKTTQRYFIVEELLADKGYSSKRNLNHVGAAGVIPYFAFQDRTTGKGGGWWSKMHGLFQLYPDEFRAHYHQRSNIEAVFSATKRVFAKSLRSRTETAMKNEAICKFLCHNIVVLIHQIHELGLDPELWTATSKNSSKIHRVF